MATILLRRRHELGIKKARLAAQKVADDLADEYGIESGWDGNVLRFSRHGLDGTLTVGRNEVALEARLGLLLSAFRSSIEDRVQQEFDRYFA